MTQCKDCIHEQACASWIRHGQTLYDDFEYSVEDCPYYNEEMGFTEKTIYLYWKTFISGASAFMKYIQEYYEKDVEIVIPPPVEDLLIRFCEQFGEVREVQNESILQN